MPPKTGPAHNKTLLSAVQTVFHVLNPLDVDTRQKVLASVYALLGTAGAQPPAQAQLVSRPLPAVSPIDTFPAGQAAKRLSLVELVSDKKPATNAQRLALFAYYREKVEGLPHFARGDLRKYFVIARISPPENYNRDFNEAVKKGWIHEEEDQSYLTSRGTEAVIANFSGERRSERPSRKAGGGTRRHIRKTGRPKR